MFHQSVAQYGHAAEYIHREEHRWVRMDIDAVIFDNSDTQKEGAEFAYTNEFSFNPLFAHLGGGWMVNAQLWPGSAHSLASGTRQFIFDSLDYGKELVQSAQKRWKRLKGYDQISAVLQGVRFVNGVPVNEQGKADPVEGVA